MATFFLLVAGVLIPISGLTIMALWGLLSNLTRNDDRFKIGPITAAALVILYVVLFPLSILLAIIGMFLLFLREPHRQRPDIFDN